MTQVLDERCEGNIPAAHGARGRVIIQCSLLLVLMAGALWLRNFYGTNTDVSWLLSTGERVLAGERLYIDLIEVNPPASVYLYMPALVLARLSGLRPEFWVDALVFAVIAASLWQCWRLLKNVHAARVMISAPFALLVVYVLAIMPAETFSQREHIAVIFLLPWMALAIARIDGAAVDLRAAILAGVCGALVFCIKPVFAVALVLCVLPVLWRNFNWRYFLLPENLTGAVVSAGYLVFVTLKHPAFFSEIMPVLDAVYIPLRAFELAYKKPWFAFWGLLALVICWPEWRRGFCHAPFVLLLASAGFALACLWQGKFWPYHYYPMFACAVLAAASVGLMQYQDVRREDEDGGGVSQLLRAGFVPLAFVAICLPRLWPLFGPMEDTRALARLIEQSGVKGAHVLALSSDISLGHPAVRQAGAKWIGSFCSLWVQSHIAIIRARFQPDAQMRAKLEKIENWHAGFLLKDLRDRQPDIILAENETINLQTWALNRHEIAAELAHYIKAHEIYMPSRRTHVSILVRQSSIP